MLGGNKITYLPGVTVTIIFPFKPVESPAVPVHLQHDDCLNIHHQKIAKIQKLSGKVRKSSISSSRKPDNLLS